MADRRRALACHGGGWKRLGVDREGVFLLRALAAHDVTVDGKVVMEIARSVKSAQLDAMRHSIEICARSITDMREALRPGVRESELLARLIYENVRRGGEYRRRAC